MYANGAKQYQTVSTQTSIVDADPHRLIQLLFEGALARIAKAKGCIANKNFEGKNDSINAAIRIVTGLQESLDMNAGELSDNLHRLYDYCLGRLFEANVKNSVILLDEVALLIIDVKSAWDAIRGQALEVFAQSN
jgi:flagellar secretion chaperone FliS